jgi:hypothetical protein
MLSLIQLVFFFLQKEGQSHKNKRNLTNTLRHASAEKIIKNETS